MLNRRRRLFTADYKINVLRPHLLHGVSVSKICRRRRLNTALFYRWKRTLLESGAAAFQPKRRVRQKDTIEKGGTPAIPKGNVPIPASHPWRPKDQEGFHWMLLLAQGQIRHDDATALFAQRLSSGDIAVLLDTIQNKPIRYRNRAIAYLAFLHGISLPTIAAFLCISPTSAYSYVDIGRNKGIDALLNPFANRRRKITEKQYVDSVFAILHAPPSTYGFNRTTWRLEDIKTVMAHKGLPLAKNNISRIIRQAGYRYRKAKKVLTSTDPDYRKKLQKITRILSRLGPREKFFQSMNSAHLP